VRLRPVLTCLAVLSCAACNVSSTELDAGSIASAPGRVEGAGDPMPIGTAVSGVIAEVLVHGGEHVAAGQLLVHLSCDNIQKELEARRATLAAAEAVAQKMVNGPRPEEIGIGVANLGLADARSEEATITLNRALALVEGVTISKAQLDQAKRDARMAAALVEEARARLNLLRSGYRQEDIDEAKARRDAAKGLVDQAQASLNYCYVRAPVAGVVVNVHATPGEFISTAIPTTLLTLVDDSKRRVRAEVDERDLAKICVPQRATVSSDSFPGVRVLAATTSLGAAVHTRTLATLDPADKGDHDVREAMLALDASAPSWPIGLRVLVKFAACPAQ
jgi:multidrug resistance efflux pump